MKKTALITGIETSIIARSICTSLLESGYEVVATSEGKYDRGKEDRIQFDAEHAEFLPVVFETVDFCSEESLLSMISRLSSRSYDVVINCAATLAIVSDGSLRNESVDFNYAEFNRVMQW